LAKADGTALASARGMDLRAALVVSSLLLSAQSQPAPPSPKLDGLLEGKDVVSLTVEAPLAELFEKGSEDEKFAVAGTLRYKDPRSGADVVVPDVAVSVRGHTSRRETECTFPKLKLKLKGSGSIKIGSHCGDAADDTLSPKYGRLQNEKAPHREALVYSLLEAAGVPVLRSRPARVTYLDKGGAPLTRNAFLLEDDDDAMTRVQGKTELTLENFGTAQARGALKEAGLVWFGQAMIGNFDWHLKISPADSEYRGTDAKPIWNVLAFDRGDGRAALVMKDFDLAGMVVGRHPFFDKIWNRAFVPSKSETEIEVLSQVQRTRSLFARAELDALRRHFLERKPAVYAALDGAVVDPKGREIARAYLDNFFKAITDAEYYRPIVARSDVRVFLDAQGTKVACSPNEVMRAGTPVNEVQKSGSMSQVIILDAMWRWASKNECNAVQDGPVWIPSDAITREYPK
jgi:hypothetical protein